MTSQEKILCVLTEIKNQIELAPKAKLECNKKNEDTIEAIVITSESYRKLGICLITGDILTNCSLNFYELENILEKVKEEGFLENFSHSFEGIDNYFKILPSKKFDELYKEFNSKVSQKASMEGRVDLNILIALLNQQYENRENYLKDPFSEQAQNWMSKTKQLIAKVDHDASQRFSDAILKYEEIKSKPISKTGELKIVCNAVTKEILEARDHLIFSDEKIKEIQMEKAYESGNSFAFLMDIISIIKQATNEIFIIDPYIDDDTFSLFLSSFQKKEGINIKILLDSQHSKLATKIITSFKASNPKVDFSVRDSKEIHDRVIFADDRCWVMGQSIKNAAEKKTTYMVEIRNVGMVKKIYDDVWKKATLISF